MKEYDESLVMRVPFTYRTRFEVKINDAGQVEILVHRPHGFAVVFVLEDSPLMFYKLLEAIERGIKLTKVERQLIPNKDKLRRRRLGEKPLRSAPAPQSQPPTTRRRIITSKGFQ